jgi:hypothetical protein
MLYREIIAVCSEIHTKHLNTVCGQNVELLNVKLAVHIMTTKEADHICSLHAGPVGTRMQLPIPTSFYSVRQTS